jgi:hypothetical protein
MISFRKLFVSIVVCCTLPVSFSPDVCSAQPKLALTPEKTREITEGVTNRAKRFFELLKNRASIETFVTTELDWPVILKRGKLPKEEKRKVIEQLDQLVESLGPDVKQQLNASDITDAEVTKVSKNFILVRLRLINSNGEILEVLAELAKESGKIVELSVAGIRVVDLAVGKVREARKAGKTSK